jgi:hypothetical protein
MLSSVRARAVGPASIGVPIVAPRSLWSPAVEPALRPRSQATPAPRGTTEVEPGFVADTWRAWDVAAAIPAAKFAVWRLCSTSELDICNGNQIDDRGRCTNSLRPAVPVVGLRYGQAKAAFGGGSRQPPQTLALAP